MQVFMGITMGLVAALMIGIGLSNIRSRAPVGFYSGETGPDVSRLLVDVRTWNKWHGILWILYGICILLSWLGGFLIGDRLLAILPVLGGLFIPLPFMVGFHTKWTKKYVMKTKVNEKKYREEAIACVKDTVLPMQKEIYGKYDGDFDRIYKEAFNNEAYTGRVIRSAKEYELSYPKCTCGKVLSGEIKDPVQCECSRQSILYILQELEPWSDFDVQVKTSILRGGDRCTFRIYRKPLRK